MHSAALARIGDDRAVAERHRGQGADQMRIVRRDGAAVRLVAGLAANRRVGVSIVLVGAKVVAFVAGVVDPRNEAVGGVALHTIAVAGGRPGGMWSSPACAEAYHCVP